jgi:probable HAF family extracellular repeat protein
MAFIRSRREAGTGSPGGPGARRYGIAAITAVVASTLLLALLAVAGWVSSSAAAQPTASPDGFGLGDFPGPGPKTQRRREASAAASGNFLLRKGVFTPLADVRGSLTAYLGSNNRGQTVGLYVGGDGAVHGFLRERKGAVTTIDVPGAQQTIAWGLNDHGQVVGIYIDAGATPGPDGLFPAGTQHAFLWDRGRVKKIDPPDAVSENQAFAINNKRQIVGAYADADGVQHGFLLDDGRYRKIDPPGSIGTKAVGINERGQIVGGYADPGAVPGPDGLIPAGTIHGYVWERGRFKTFDLPGSRATAASAINNRGQIVGQYKDAAGRIRGFLRSNRGFTPIDPPDGRPDSAATDIDDRGQILIPPPGSGFSAIYAVA